MNHRQFQPGFRISARDVVALVVGGGAAVYAATVDPWLGVAIAYVVGHFFLFCNVLRMSRPLELAWAAVFTALAIAAISASLRWPAVFGISAVVTVGVAVLEMWRPTYHGVGWQKINPQLSQWWRSASGNALPGGRT